MASSISPSNPHNRPEPTTPEIIFYDGGCGLCHRWVKLAMKADADGSLFRFAPLQGTTIEDVLTADQRADLPDSIIVYTRNDHLLLRTSAVIHVFRTLGGWHALMGNMLRLFPRPLRDFGYDTVARIRHRLFKKPAQSCPLMPPEMQGRFLP